MKNTEAVNNNSIYAKYRYKYNKTILQQTKNNCHWKFLRAQLINKHKHFFTDLRDMVNHIF